MPGGIRLLAQAEADITTPPADEVTIFANADDANAPAYKDELGAVTPLKGDTGADAPALSYQNHGNTGSTETIDASAADVHRLVLDDDCTITLSGAPSSGTVKVIQVYLEQDGTGGWDVTWPGSVVWGVAGEPDWTDRGAGDIDLVSLETVDGGTTWVAAVAGRPGATGATGAAGSGSMATDSLWDAAGDLAVGTGADTAGKLSIGAASKVPTSNGTTLAYAYPPGYEFDYVQKTSQTAISATTEATANTVVTGSAVTYDGSTVVEIEFYAPYFEAPGSQNARIALYDGSSSIGIWAVLTPSSSTSRVPVCLKRRLTPSAAAHTYSVRAYVDSGAAVVDGGAGGSGARMPAFIRITKV